MTARTAALAALSLLAAGVLAGGAQADGLPVLGVDAGADGVAAPGSVVRHVTVPAAGGTVVARIGIGDGRVLGSRFLRGRFTIPAVAYDGTADGLSADRRTLVLIEPRAAFPRDETRFAVLDAETLRLRALLMLPGDFSFDALSPDGRSLYLIRYLSPDDPNSYEVRAYDLVLGRLLREPIVDPAEAGEEMRGAPITRATSRDGRWAYTLYDGAGGHPFVHALDTVDRTARCIDLHELAGRGDLFRLQLRLSGSTLAVTSGRAALALIDTATFEVRRPEPAAVPPAPAPDGTSRLPFAGGAALLLVAAAALAARRRRARQSGSSGISSPVSRPRSTARVTASLPKRERTESTAASSEPSP